MREIVDSTIQVSRIAYIYIYIGDRGFPVTIGIRRYLRESSR